MIEFKLKETSSLIPNCKAYKFNGNNVFVGIEDGKWHLSISNKFRYPTWEEIKFCRYTLMPNEKTIAMILPPTQDFINVDKNCFHLWEI